MKIELHCHSYYSKGTKLPLEALDSPEDIVKAAKKNGLGGLALTDHDTIRGWKEAEVECKRAGILFIPGMEIETEKGHVLGIGISEDIKDKKSFDSVIDSIKRQGGLAIAAHPFDLGREGVGNNLGRMDAIEAFNAISIDRVSNWFAERKAKKLGKPIVCGSDAHLTEMVGRAYNIIEANTLDEALKEIKSGRVEIVKGYQPLKPLVAWYRKRFKGSYPDVMDYIGRNYCWPKAWIAKMAIDSFISSKGLGWSAWNAAAKFGLGCSVVYSGVRLMRY